MSDSAGLIQGDDGASRCWWGAGSPDYAAYHDREWGFPVVDDTRLFEKICLEGFQAGLSWLTILRKRDNFREAFAGFDIERVAKFTPRHVERLLTNAGIVRHRGKIESTINNARGAIELINEHGSLSRFFWKFEPPPESRPPLLTKAVLCRITMSDQSRALSRDLKKRGWSFVGPTTMYAFMQAMGLVNDHIEGCHVRAAALRARAGMPDVAAAP